MLSSVSHPLIGIDPEIRFGRPCIVGTRISVRDVLGWLSHGMNTAEIIADFPELTPATIEAAQAYAADCVKPYSQVLEREPDFCVSYRLFSPEEGGRKTPAYQHIRWDFCYENKVGSSRSWMIWPEMLDPDNYIIPNGPFAPLGRANMFSINPERRSFHHEHLWPGMRGYFVEGAKRIGVCEVLEVFSLR